MDIYNQEETMRTVYILLLFTFGFGQDYSLEFDREDDWVEIPNDESLNMGSGSFCQYPETDVGEIGGYIRNRTK